MRNTSQDCFGFEGIDNDRLAALAQECTVRKKLSTSSVAPKLENVVIGSLHCLADPI